MSGGDSSPGSRQSLEWDAVRDVSEITCEIEVGTPPGVEVASTPALFARTVPDIVDALMVEPTVATVKVRTYPSGHAGSQRTTEKTVSWSLAPDDVATALADDGAVSEAAKATDASSVRIMFESPVNGQMVFSALRLHAGQMRIRIAGPEHGSPEKLVRNPDVSHALAQLLTATVEMAHTVRYGYAVPGLWEPYRMYSKLPPTPREGELCGYSWITVLPPPVLDVLGIQEGSPIPCASHSAWVSTQRDDPHLLATLADTILEAQDTRKLECWRTLLRPALPSITERPILLKADCPADMRRTPPLLLDLDWLGR